MVVILKANISHLESPLKWQRRSNTWYVGLPFISRQVGGLLICCYPPPTNEVGGGYRNGFRPSVRPSVTFRFRSLTTNPLKRYLRNLVHISSKWWTGAFWYFLIDRSHGLLFLLPLLSAPPPLLLPLLSHPSDPHQSLKDPHAFPTIPSLWNPQCSLTVHPALLSSSFLPLVQPVLTISGKVLPWESLWCFHMPSASEANTLDHA